MDNELSVSRLLVFVSSPFIWSYKFGKNEFREASNTIQNGYRPDEFALVLFVRRLCDSRGLSVEGCGDGTVESSDPREDRRLVPEPEITINSGTVAHFPINVRETAVDIFDRHID